MPEIETVPEAEASRSERGLDASDSKPGIGSYVGTVALVGLGVALIEEELLAGMALGVAAMAFPSVVPKLGRALRPLFKSAVRAGYGMADRTREAMAEMSEQFEDMKAEVRAERTYAHSGAEAHDGGAQAPAGDGPRAAPNTGTASSTDADSTAPKKTSRANRTPPEAAE